MTCTPIDLGNGAYAIVCTRGAPRKRCTGCGKLGASKLCDFALVGSKKGKTCDAPICGSCAVVVGPDRDYCPVHHRLVAGHALLDALEAATTPEAQATACELGKRTWQFLIAAQRGPVTEALKRARERVGTR